MFRTGMKVVCIDKWPRDTWRDRWDRFWHPYKSPKKGAIYTVSNVYSVFDEQYLELLELPSPQTDVWLAGFFACGFRPLVERKTDISFARAILRKASRKIRERA